MSAPKTPPGTATAPLLYWLLIVCGLAALSIQRLDTPSELLPLWLGTVVGVGLGQLVAWARIRAWVLGVFALAAAWFSPVFLFVLYQSIRGPAETCFFAFVPAAICGYLSLSERGGLVAFWYPAVLWMLVILDGPAAGAGAFEARTAVPLVIGLAGLFIAFLRARETRRVALWHGNATVRLAAPKPRAVLRASPLRAASQVAWTGFASAAALVLAAWVAPHLWQKEQAKRPHATAAPQATSLAGTGAPEEEQACCPENDLVDARRVRVREYFPLFAGQDAEERRLATTPCTVCRDGSKVASTASNGGYEGTPGAGLRGTSYDGPYTGVYGGSVAGARGSDPPVYSTPTPVTPSLPSPTPVVPSSTTPKPPPVAIVPTTTTTPTPVVTPPVTPQATPKATPPMAAAKPARPVAIVLVPKPAAPPDAGAPWKSMLAFCASGLALHVLVRAVRRQLRLRHLARPFWPETLDQRISNHWERMLIGLRDAGIDPAPDEQPEALARRVGIEGMDTCATILERVRHGVAVDASDLETMDSAAGAVYRAARVRAGVGGRAAAWLRWPLA